MSELTHRYLAVRQETERLAAGLSDEDQMLQSMVWASPTKWHRAHTTWFFETFILKPVGVAPFNDTFAFLFNSYYEGVGERIRRDLRGLMSRPSVSEITAYRQAVDAQMVALIEQERVAADVVELGLHHEQQHQELLLTDILHAFSLNPTGPVYREGTPSPATHAPEQTWHAFDGGLREIGAHGDGFTFDNEHPRHRVYLRPFELASRPISVGEVRAFIEAGGYQTPTLWLSEGYQTAQNEGWQTPLYTRVRDGVFETFSLRGWRQPSDDEPAMHLSFWEAEAIARFLSARLPTEAEWEVASAGLSADDGNFSDGELVPNPATSSGLAQMFGDVWEWTRSSYEPYPGYHPPAGAIGEYNGKFMAQQYVLRGGSCFTPRGHVRDTYRNFWPPSTRFQAAGARLARDL